MAFAITHDPATIDPKAVGMRAGLEIHQQLSTKKLFCNCPSVLRDDAPHFTILRRLRASAGESGEIDRAARHETIKEKEFQYVGYNDTTCLVEIDEEPPHPLNPDALAVALSVAKLFSMTILPRSQVMRKTVVDGSNTGGFQRTMLVALGGEMTDPAFGTIRMQTLCLEEDAAQIIERTPAYDTYNLSRLGIPLIELATEPDLTTPDAVREAAGFIGMALRSTRKVRRGIGTIRQDVNVSIREGARVEIKGAQDLRTLHELARIELARQSALVALKRELSGKASRPTEIFAVSGAFARAKGFAKKIVDSGGAVLGIGFPGMRGLFGSELYPGYRVGTELAGYAKAHGFGGLIHSDEDATKYGFEDWALVRHALKIDDTAAFLLLAGEKEKARAVLEQVLLPRVRELWNGVPEEVRKANPDNTTTYLRPMPGAARMYPETDIPDIVLDANDIAAPKLLKEQIAEFAARHKLTPALAKEAIEEPLFEHFVSAFPNIPPLTSAEAIITYPKEIKTRFTFDVDASQPLFAASLTTTMSYFNEGKIPREAIFEAEVEAARQLKENPGREPVIEYTKYFKADTSEVEKIVDEVIAADPSAPVNALMGAAMTRLRGKADGKLVLELLQKKKR